MYLVRIRPKRSSTWSRADGTQTSTLVHGIPLTRHELTRTLPSKERIIAARRKWLGLFVCVAFEKLPRETKANEHAKPRLFSIFHTRFLTSFNVLNWGGGPTKDKSYGGIINAVQKELFTKLENYFGYCFCLSGSTAVTHTAHSN